jgi:toxin ParE1/3/4
MKQVVFAAEAKDEFDAAAFFYEMQRVGLGDAFVDAVQAAIQRIAATPLAFATHRPTGTRKYVLRRFPYSLYFLELETSIWIAAIAHQRRRPRYWAHREPGQR